MQKFSYDGKEDSAALLGGSVKLHDATPSIDTITIYISDHLDNTYKVRLPRDASHEDFLRFCVVTSSSKDHDDFRNFFLSCTEYGHITHENWRWITTPTSAATSALRLLQQDATRLATEDCTCEKFVNSNLSESRDFELKHE